MIPINLELLGFPISQSDAADQNDIVPCLSCHACIATISFYAPFTPFSTFFHHADSRLSLKPTRLIWDTRSSPTLSTISINYDATKF